MFIKNGVHVVIFNGITNVTYNAWTIKGKQLTTTVRNEIVEMWNK